MMLTFIAGQGPVRARRKATPLNGLLRGRHDLVGDRLHELFEIDVVQLMRLDYGLCRLVFR
jgi:hypothetical protein